MIKIEVTKIWLGKVSIREHIYKKALRKKESIGIVHGKEYVSEGWRNDTNFVSNSWFERRSVIDLCLVRETFVGETFHRLIICLFG